MRRACEICDRDGLPSSPTEADSVSRILKQAKWHATCKTRRMRKNGWGAGANEVRGAKKKKIIVGEQITPDVNHNPVN